jgi:outer membrane receptor protein involved in Fe transport
MPFPSRSLILAFAAASLLAQTDRGSIRGQVADPTGAAIAGAVVTAKDLETGVVVTAESTDAGSYNIPALRAGVYRLEATAAGFRRTIRDQVKVDVSSAIAVDIQMEVGDVSESVTVEASAATLKTDTTEVSLAINPKTYTDLPLTFFNRTGGRSPEEFIFLAPGTSGDAWTGTVNGGQQFSREIQLDGLSVAAAELQGDTRNLQIPPDAIQEFSLATSNFSAEYGNAGGGVARYTIRSGTNEIKGSLYEYFRNDKLDARGFFNPIRAVNRQNEFGGTIGGPILVPKVYNGKNRSFFFLNMNYFRFRSGPSNQLASLPTPAFKAGDFSELRDGAGNIIPLYDPLTTRSDGAGGLTRDMFTGNRIPAGRLSSVSRAINTYLPDPPLPGITNNFPSVGRVTQDNQSFTFKIDHQVNSKHRLNGSWNRGILEATGDPPYVLPSPLSSSRGTVNPRANNVRFSYDWVVSPTILHHFSMGLTRQLQLLQSVEWGQDWGTKLGLRSVNNGSFPGVNFEPFTSLAGTLQDKQKSASTTFLFADSMSIVVGKHNIKFGADYRRYQNNFTRPSTTGIYTFNRNRTAFPTSTGRATTGFGYASFLLGDVDSSTMNISEVTRGMRFPYLGTYVQDDYRVSKTLTLNLGLRWDLFYPFREVNNVYSIMDPSIPNPGAGNLPGALIFAGDGAGRAGRERLFDKVFYKAFGPRIGLAWSATPQLVVRAAYGISYLPGAVMGGSNAKPPALGFEATPAFISGDQGITPAFNWDSGYPQNFDRPPFINPAFNLRGNVPSWNENGHVPSNRQEWNFTIQRQLGSSWLVDAAYVGAKGTHLASSIFNLNQVDPSFLRLGDLLTRPITDPAVAAAGFRAPYPGFTGSLAQALRPFPQYLTVDQLRSSNVGNSTYHSFQTKVEKRFSSGLFVLANYTWSKTLTDSARTLGMGSARDHYNRRIEKGLADYDLPHRVVMAFNYELPFGAGKSWVQSGVAEKFLGGWQINGIFNYQSGNPVRVSVANTLPIFNGANAPDSVLGVDPEFPRDNFDPGAQRLLNIAAFRTPAPFTIGTSAQVLPTVRNFILLNENFGVMKRIRFAERVLLETRFEMFNMFNRTRFGSPLNNVSDPFNFGRVVSQANLPRQGQFAMKLMF